MKYLFLMSMMVGCADPNVIRNKNIKCDTTEIITFFGKNTVIGHSCKIEEAQ